MSNRGPKPKSAFARVMARTLEDEATGCWLFQGAKADKGHGVVGEEVTGRALKAHRVSWEGHNGPIPDGLCVCHKCDVPSCVNPAHLFLGTVADNNRDMRQKLRHCKGEAHHMAKLSCDDVRAIRALGDDVIQAEVARLYGVNPSHISRIRSGDSWRHLEKRVA